jgi:hypothetical protein
LASSNTAAPRDHASGNFTFSAFRRKNDQGLDNPRSSLPEGHFQLITTPQNAIDPRIEAKIISSRLQRRRRPPTGQDHLYGH